jgi:hypothetical protein
VSDTADALVVFGITGDLARRSTLPALYDLTEREILARKRDQRGHQHPDESFTDDHAGGQEHAQLFGGLGLRTGFGAPVEDMAGHRAHHHHQRALRRQVDPEADREWREVGRTGRAAQQLVDGNHDHADQGADPDQ